MACALLLVACGATRSQAAQDQDESTVAAAIRSAIVQGVGFKLDETLTLTGGSIPSGQMAQAHATAASGLIKNDTAQFGYQFDQGGGHVSRYDMMLADQQVYVRNQGSSSWKTTPLSLVTPYFAAARLDLVRETVLLASSISGAGYTHVAAGFARRYTVKPAPDQLEQLESAPVAGAAETQFLKRASAEVDVFLALQSNQLLRVEVHTTEVDPSDGSKQVVDSAADIRPARVGAINPPTDATTVSPSNILS
jgi:hypothetical protein